MNQKNTEKFLLVSILATISGLALVHNTSAATYTLNMTSSGAQVINLPTSGDGVAISADEINVTTTCRYGYNFVINTSVNDNNLYLTGSASNNTAGTYFSPVDGTSTLNNSTNAWGYYYNSDSSVVPTKSSVFSPVPALGQTAIIKSASSTAASSDIDDSFNLYYGVKTSPTMASGTYKMIPDTNNQGHDGTIVYQATIADNCMRYTVEFNPTSTAGGTTLSGTGTMSNQNIYEDVATPLSNNSFTAPTGYYFAGWNTAQDGTGTTYTNGQNVTNITTVGSTITLYAQWTDCPGGTICYKENGANVVGTMGQQTVSSSATSITLLASNFSRTGYGFAGWSDVEDYATNPNAHFYGPQEDITFIAGQYATRGLKLYAVWIASAGSLQFDTPSVCATLTTAPTDGTTNLSSVSALTDQRDNQTYAIAKLADGNCWMIENLRLESTNSDNSTGALAQGYGTSTTYGNFSGLADAESSGFSATYSANSLYSNDGSNNTINIGTSNNTAYRMPRYNNWNNQSASANRPQNPTANDATNSTTNAGMYSYGNYYTWHAAIADTTYYSSGDHGTTSLCPKGWRLPIGSQSTANMSFGKLSVELGGPANGATADSSSTPTGTEISKAFRSYPNNFLYSGLFSSSTALDRGSYGYYWSSTVGSYRYSYHMLLSNTSVVPGANISMKYYGLSIRCVATSPQPVSTPADSIGYYANATNVEGTMGLQSITSSDTSATLLASNFSKDGYGFAGWSDVPDYYTNSSAHFYGPQEDITFTAGQYSTSGLSLYAVWVRSEGSLQDSQKVTSVCNRLTTAPTNGTANLSSVSALTDQRDNETYAIAKLADGNCWMIENLRLDNTAELTTLNTHNPLNDGTSVTLKHNYSDTETYNTLSASQDPTSTAWCNTNSDSCDNQSMLFTGNTTNRANSPTTNGTAIYSYGNYYNWYSATAGRGTYSFSTNNNSVAGDLCPAGWHLPKGGNKANVDVSDFWKLSRATIGADPESFVNESFVNDYFYYAGTPEGTDASNKLRAYPNNFVYSGGVHVGSVNSRGSGGYFWSSTAYSSSSAYYLYLYSSVVDPGTDGNYKYSGRTVRCVAGP